MRRRNSIRYKEIINYFKRRLHYKRQVNKIIFVLVALILILILKRLNNSISSNIIQIIDNSINYEFSVKKDGKVILDQGKKLLMLPEKTLSVLNIKQEPKYIPPIEGTIYKPFGGNRQLGGNTNFNNGVDIIPKEEKEPISIEKGIVKDIEDRGSKGYYVIVEHESITTIYGYLTKVYVEKGEEVIQGTKIGSLGTNKDGNKYLHFEIWVEGVPVNPVDYIKFNTKI